MTCPCKGCRDRKVGCHSGCEGYLEWRKYIGKAKRDGQLEYDLYCLLRPRNRSKRKTR